MHIMVIIGLIGTFITGFKLCIKSEDYKKDTEEVQQRQLDEITKVVNRNKLKDNGIDIDEAVKTIKEIKEKEKI